ncbi:MAG: guanylate kinase [Nitrospirae bacterium]|nr:guanylate kinase [Nitrospirota bacterium]
MSNLQHSVSVTTRPPRLGEVGGRDYYFVAREAFQTLVAQDAFVEWAEVHGHLYGTKREEIHSRIEMGQDVLLDIDTQGAMQIRRQFRDGVFIFILPPSLEDLLRRLRGRKSDAEQEIQRRMGRAKDEIADYALYDYVIVNEGFDSALRELQAVILAERRRTARVDADWIREVFGPPRPGTG